MIMNSKISSISKQLTNHLLKRYTRSRFAESVGKLDLTDNREVIDALIKTILNDTDQ